MMENNTLYDPEQEGIITTREEAEKALQTLAYWEAQEAEVTEHALAQRQKVDEWMHSRLEKINRKQSWHKGTLKAYLEAQHTKKLSLANGSVNIVRGRDKLVLSDEHMFGKWLEEADDGERDDFVVHAIRPNMKRINQHFKLTGEIPGGFELETPPEQIRIKLQLDLPLPTEADDSFVDMEEED